jgi:acetyltransferase-like isoleucine patch superfamily enzyme
VVMADVGHDCVIGAGSVIVRPIPAYAVAAGNPAVVKRMRCDESTHGTDSPRSGPAFRVREFASP